MKTKQPAPPLKTKQSTPAQPPKAKKPVAPARPAKKRIEFKFHAPDARDVLVAGSFTDWAGRTMKRDEEGIWKAGVALPPGTYEYRFIVDGEWRDDPECPDRVPNDHGGQNCVVEVRTA